MRATFRLDVSSEYACRHAGQRRRYRKICGNDNGQSPVPISHRAMYQSDPDARLSLVRQGTGMRSNKNLLVATSSFQGCQCCATLQNRSCAFSPNAILENQRNATSQKPEQAPLMPTTGLQAAHAFESETERHCLVISLHFAKLSRPVRNRSTSALKGRISLPTHTLRRRGRDGQDRRKFQGINDYRLHC